MDPVRILDQIAVGCYELGNGASIFSCDRSKGITTFDGVVQGCRACRWLPYGSAVTAVGNSRGIVIIIVIRTAVTGIGYRRGRRIGWSIRDIGAYPHD